MQMKSILKFGFVLLLWQATAIQAATTVTNVVGGGYWSFFLKSDGSLWGMGSNNDGELGDGTYNNTNRPEQINATNVVAMAAGVLHSLFIKSNPKTSQ